MKNDDKQSIFFKNITVQQQVIIKPTNLLSYDKQALIPHQLNEKELRRIVAVYK
jgi:hypothetical protein